VVLEELIINMEELSKASGTDQVKGGDGNGYILTNWFHRILVFNSCQKFFFENMLGIYFIEQKN
jgi:hypothetical protein